MVLHLSMVPDDGPAGPWEAAYAYLDEQHPTPEDPTFAVGVLLVPQPLSTALIAEALNALPASSSVRTRGGWFHAKDDGRDAQRALAEAFARHTQAAEFHSFRWDPRREQRAGPSSQEERHMHVAALALGHACEVARSAINVEYASGPTIDLPRFQAWMAEQQDVRLRTMLMQKGAVPMRFPRVDISECDARRSAGIQVADLILWHERRRRARLDPRCRDLLIRAKLRDEMSWKQDDGPMETSLLGRKAPGRVTYRPPARPPETWAAFAQAVVGIERAVHEIATLPPAHVAHLVDRIRRASAAMDGYLGTDLERLRELLRVFLMLVDTVPLYGDTNAQTASDFVWVATSMNDLRLPECVSRLDQWVEIRSLTVGGLGWPSRNRSEVVTS